MPKVIINSMGDATQKLAKYIRQYETGKLTTERFRALVYAISQYITGLKNAKEVEDFQKQIDELREFVK